MKRLRWSTQALLLLWSGFAFGAQSDVEIQQKSIECWPVDEFLLVQSSFVPPGDIQTAKFYFRSTALPDYYYVELSLGPGGGRAIAPKAHPDTTEVTFYTELVTRGFSAFRTDERTVPVASGSECKRRDPGAAFYTGQNPDIAVGATRLGATPLPPGFQADGIARFLSATGISGEAAAGGVSGKTLGIIAGAGGAGAAFLLLGGGSDATTSSPVGGITTSSPASSSTTSAAGGVSSTTTTAGGGGSSTSSATTTVGGGGSTTTIVGSTTTIIGSTTTIIGSSTTTVIGSSTTTTVGTSSSTTTTIGTSTTTIPGTTTSTSTTTIPGTTSSTTTTSIPSTTSTAGAAQLQIRKSDGTDPVRVSTIFNYFLDITNVGSAGATGVSIQDPIPAGVQVLFISNGSCRLFGTTMNCFNLSIPAGQTLSIRIQVRSPSSAGMITNRATVSWSGNSASDSETTTVTLTLRDSDASREPVIVKTFLDIEPYNGRSRGRVAFNDSEAVEITNSAPVVHNATALAGENHVEATLLGSARTQGIWRFDFGGTRRFVPGSIHVDSGQVYAQDARTIAFAVSPSSAPLRFRFELETRDP